ncbi:MAG TPA: serine/threonine protein kinase [Planctomycetes bacterium]|nr:serine/threonine protein kinase [Planctomycetota bacterium]
MPPGRCTPGARTFPQQSGQGHQQRSTPSLNTTLHRLKSAGPLLPPSPTAHPDSKPRTHQSLTTAPASPLALDPGLFIEWRRSGGPLTANRPPVSPPPSDSVEPVNNPDENPTVLADLHGDAPVPEVLPDAIGPYRVLEHLGRGAFGNVYLCQERETPRRKLAVKVIRAGMDTREVLARFEAEKNAMILMDHPSIARVIGAGSTDDGKPYFAMEYVPGQPISQFCSAEKLSIDERLSLFGEVCRAIQHAHSKAVVHRDLKPSNILAARIDGRIQVKIIDFGLVKSLQQPLVDQTLHTLAGQAVGTFEYMSPEQARSRGGDVDTRTDIYALGAILYELLTGELAFAGIRERSYEEILETITEQDPPRPSLRLSQLDALQKSHRADDLGTDLDVLRRSLGNELDWVVMKALEKDRDRRYQTAQEMAAEIDRYLAGDAIEARPPSAVYRLKKSMRRHRGVLTATALVFVALVVGMTWALLAEQKERERAAELELVVQFQEKQFSGIDVPGMGVGLRRQLIDRSMAVAESSGLAEEELDQRRKELEQALLIDWTGISRETLEQYIFEPALETIDEQFQSQPLLRARLLQTVATTLQDLGLLEMATQPQEQALLIRREILGDAHPDTLSSISNMGTLLKQQGKLGEAGTFSSEALEGRRRVLGDDHPDTLSSINNMGTLLYSRGKLNEAEPFYREALEGARLILGDDHPGTLISIGNMGLLLMQQDKWDEAEPFYRKSLEGLRRVLGDDHPDTLISIGNMGVLLKRQGKLDEAETFYRESLEGKRRVLGDDHPYTLQSINNIGALLQFQDKLDEAETFYHEALEGRRRVLGEDHPYTLISINNMGSLLFFRGKLVEAEPFFREALEGSRLNLGDDHPDTLSSISNMGRLLRDLGRLEEAEALVAEAVERARRVLPAGHSYLGNYLTNHSRTLVAMKRFDEAKPRALEAHAIFEAKLGSTHKRTNYALRVLVELYNRWHEAEPDAGHDRSAAEWQAKLEAATPKKIEATPPPDPED